MAKVSIITPDKVRTVPPPAGCSGLAEAKAYLDGKSSLHLHLFELHRGHTLRIEQGPIDRVIYVWQGDIDAAGHALAQGSSVIVEHGRALTIKGHSEESEVLVFAAADASSQSRAGGHIHLMPSSRVPRTRSLGQASDVAGGMHADSACPTCEVWLHESSFPGQVSASSEQEERGVHSHTENEIIFVTEGQVRLGPRLYGPGTALAIAANTLYGFTAGPAGLRFVNFRSGTPGDIRFANGGSMSETAYWRERVSRPEYLEVNES